MRKMIVMIVVAMLAFFSVFFNMMLKIYRRLAKYIKPPRRVTFAVAFLENTIPIVVFSYKFKNDL